MGGRKVPERLRFSSLPRKLLECSHGNRKREASFQDGDQLVNGRIPQRQGVLGEEGRASVFTLKEGTI